MLPLYLFIDEVYIELIEFLANTLLDVYLTWEEVSFNPFISDNISYMPYKSLILVLKKLWFLSWLPIPILLRPVVLYFPVFI